MQIGVFGDVHGNLAALQAVLADGNRQGVDTWVCLGDVAFKGPQPTECIDTISALPHLTQIVGNTDQWLFQGFPGTFNVPPERRRQLEAFRTWGLAKIPAAALSRLSALPFSHSMQLGQKPTLFVHSSPRSTEDWLPASLSESDLSPLLAGHDAQIVVYGHVHNAFIRKVNGRVIINTGSTGNPTDGDNQASYALLTFSDGVFGYSVRRVPYDINATIEAARTSGMPMCEQYAEALQTGSAL